MTIQSDDTGTILLIDMCMSWAKYDQTVWVPLWATCLLVFYTTPQIDVEVHKASIWKINIFMTARG